MSGNDATPLVRVRGLTKSFATNQVLKGVDLDVMKGQVVSVIGASGSGKTTLLRCVNLLETYDGGSIQVDGVEVGYSDATGRRRPRGERELARIRADIGMVFQLFNLFPHLTARDNVVLGLRKVRGMDRAAARVLAEQWLARVGLSDKFDSLPIELSGGRDVSTRVVFMDAGRVAVEGSPNEVFATQSHERLRSFLARIELKQV